MYRASARRARPASQSWRIRKHVRQDQPPAWPGPNCGCTPVMRLGDLELLVAKIGDELERAAERGDVPR